MIVVDDVGAAPTDMLSTVAKPALVIPDDTPPRGDMLSGQCRNDAFIRRHGMTHGVNSMSRKTEYGWYDIPRTW